MQADERQSLIDKIESLAPEARERVKGYVDALVERQLLGTTTRAHNEESGGSRSQGRDKEGEETSEAKDRQDSEDRFLCQDWAGALSDLKDEYTSLELEEEIKKQWMKMTHD